jgi:hypothetical protein
MERMKTLFALALAGAFVASAGAYAAQADNPPGGFQPVAVVAPSIGFGAADGQRDVIVPPSSLDAGMWLDPPQIGARMPIVHPPGMMPDGHLVLPR